jgi:hypothetical protein
MSMGNCRAGAPPASFETGNRCGCPTIVLGHSERGRGISKYL